MKFVAPIPEQIATTTMHFPGPKRTVLKVFSSKVKRYFFRILSTGDIEKPQFWVTFSPLG